MEYSEGDTRVIFLVIRKSGYFFPCLDTLVMEQVFMSLHHIIGLLALIIIKGKVLYITDVHLLCKTQILAMIWALLVARRVARFDLFMMTIL